VIQEATFGKIGAGCVGISGRGRYRRQVPILKAPHPFSQFLFPKGVENKTPYLEVI